MISSPAWTLTGHFSFLHPLFDLRLNPRAIPAILRSLDESEGSLDPAARLRKRKAEQPIDQSSEEKDLRLQSEPSRVGDDAAGDSQKVQKADDRHQAGIFKKAD